MIIDNYLVFNIKYHNFLFYLTKNEVLLAI